MKSDSGIRNTDRVHDRDFLLFQFLDVGFPSLCRNLLNGYIWSRSPNCFVVNLSSLVRRLKRSFCQRANRVIALNRAAILTEYACRYTMVVLWVIVVPHIAHASFCDTVDSEAAHASQRQIRFQSWRKATKGSFLKNKPTLCVKTSQIC